MKKSFVFLFFIVSMALSSLALSTPLDANNGLLDEPEPRYGLMVTDLVIARPLSFVATITGSILYVVSLPFSIAGGNHDEVANALVRAPAYNTFQRCLGCTISDKLREIEAEEALLK